MTERSLPKLAKLHSACNDDLQADDTWAGLTDPSERRRRQNRINQRIHRKRKRIKLQQEDIHLKSLVVSSSSISATQAQDTTRPGNSPTNVHFKQILRQFIQSAYQSYSEGDPAAEHLFTLTKVNVFLAFTQNMRLIGWPPGWMNDDPNSRLSNSLSQKKSTLNDYSHIPINLRPTRVQITVPHHPWLDLFPLPKMRDNLIAAGQACDHDQLCHDIMGFWGEPNLQAGLLVWGKPWDVRSWEVTEPFLKKWQWVIRDCPELMSSTNTWRARRGEQLIFRYL
ncbi:uncharacterized protein N7511_005113 [Penicillium nucicola]|uniref:uncharacterized protein n=1 Tax=Penicillium nucicola TaxID=1850975 RepID=UPI002545A69A|nr:uncharacterized protein N7511_005113 [Penicillium nucicola]KAJ5761731.1 hypothetical protein N7511_005113 [Penicillium nucicola]